MTASVTSPAAAVPPWAGWKRSCRAAAWGVVEFTNKNWGMLSWFIAPITIWFMVDKIYIYVGNTYMVYSSNNYPLVNIQKAMEYGPFIGDLPIQIMIFHSYVSLPEGIWFMDVYGRYIYILGIQ